MGEYAEERGRQKDLDAKVERVAKVCHEANRVLTRLLNDVPVQPAWAEAPEEMKASSRKGVLFALENPDATPEAQHEAWCQDKIADGWVRGDTKDSVKKTHPSLRPYIELSLGVKSKDEMFRAIVGSVE